MKAVLLLLLLAHTATAETRKPVTLADAIAATAKAPRAAPVAAELVAAEANVAAAGAWPDPALRLGTSRLTAKVVAGAALPLPVFGTVGAARHKAAAEAAVVRVEADIELRSLRHRVVQAWIELARADGAVVASSIAAQHAAELELIAKGRKDAGVSGDLDVVAATAAKARAEVDADAAHHLLDAASAELAGLLGWDPAVPLHAEGGLVTGGAAAVDSLRAKLLSHPVHVLAQDRVAVAASSVRAVRADRWPKIALEAELLYDDRTVTEGRTPWDRTDATVVFAIDLPIFAHVGDRMRAARATESAERMRVVATDAELSAGLFAAYQKWQAAAVRLERLERDVLPPQERAAALSAQAFREGAKDLAYALQAQRELAAVQAEVISARANAATAFADLQLAAGGEVGRAP